MYWLFLSLASAMVLTVLQLRAQLLLTRQIMEQRIPQQPLQHRKQRRHLVLGLQEEEEEDSYLTTSAQFVYMHSISWAASCLQSLLMQADNEYDVISIQLSTTDTANHHLLQLLRRLRERYPTAQLRLDDPTKDNRLLSAAFDGMMKPSNTTLQQGTWGAGDACYWFHKEDAAPEWIQFNARAVHPVQSLSLFRRLRNRQTHASHNNNYYYYNDNAITVHNPFDTARMLYLTYRTGQDEALTRIRVDGIPTVLIDPYREEDSSGWEMSPVGKLAPKEVTRVQWDSQPLYGGTFRLVGVSFGASENEQ